MSEKINTTVIADEFGVHGGVEEKQKMINADESGALYRSLEGDVELTEMSKRFRQNGREDDLLILNFMNKDGRKGELKKE